MEELKAKLSNNKIRPTFIRLKILELLNKRGLHPTADMIYEELRKEIPTISKMSVYNTLNLFSSKGIVFPLLRSNAEARYDLSAESHHHFECENCLRIFDIKSLGDNNIFAMYRNSCGHAIKNISINFSGICSDCRRAKEN